MKNSKYGGLLKIIGIISLIIGVVTVIVAAISRWDELRDIFPWLPELNIKLKATDYDPDYDDFDDFADM